MKITARPLNWSELRAVRSADTRAQSKFRIDGRPNHKRKPVTVRDYSQPSSPKDTTPPRQFRGPAMRHDHHHRSLLRDVCRTYEAARRRYVNEQARGCADRADDALSEMQTIEDSIHVTELNTAWRAPKAAVVSR
jgi:hypothetical protein